VTAQILALFLLLSTFGGNGDPVTAEDVKFSFDRYKGSGAKLLKDKVKERPEIDDLFQRQANELDRKKREATLHEIQQIVADQVLAAPIFQQAFPWGVGARVEQPAAGLIQGYPYVGPAEDLKLK
jgi:ABC-type transport system substrate-binding protein